MEWVSLRAMAVAIALEHHRDLDVAVKVYQEVRRAMGMEPKSHCREYMKRWLREYDDGNTDLRCVHHPGRPTIARGLSTVQVAEMLTTPHLDGSRPLPFYSIQQVSLRVISFMPCHAATHLLSSLVPHSLTFTPFQAREYYPELQQWATEFNLSDRYI